MTLPLSKPVRERDRGHRAFIGSLACVACAVQGVVTHGSDCAHVTFLQPRGMAQKAGDQFTAPLCRPHHDEQHAQAERLFWSRLGVDPRRLCAELWEASGDHVEAESIIGAHAAEARRAAWRIRPAGEMLEPVTLSRSVLIEATTSDARDESGNVIVHLPTLGPRGTPPIRAAVDPHAIQETGQ